MKMKWIPAALAALLILAGCSQSDGNSSSQGSSSQEVPSSSEESSSEESSETGIDWDAITLKQFESPEPGSEIATMKTSMGDIKVMFFPSDAPLAVENFITHAKEGYYDGLTFHRVIDDFMIQGGDPNGNGTGGESIWGEPFEDEFSLSLWPFRGALAMANAGEDTNGSQFFIVQCPTVTEDMAASMEAAGYGQKVIDKFLEVGGTPHLSLRHTVFGQVLEGMDVVDAIAAVETDENDKPVEDVIIESITFETVPDDTSSNS